MRVAFLTFEFVLMIGFFWAGIWNIGLMGRAISDYGTIVDALLFFAFGVLTAVMLLNEAAIFIRDRFGIELNPFRVLATRMAHSAPETEE